MGDIGERQGEGSQPIVTGVVRFFEVSGALIAALGTALVWGTESSFIGPVEIRGYSQPAGWIVIVSALIVLVLQWNARGPALAALPSIAGGIAIGLWLMTWPQSSPYVDGLSRSPEIGVLVPLAGLGVVGAASLVALGVLANSSERRRLSGAQDEAPRYH